MHFFLKTWLYFFIRFVSSFQNDFNFIYLFSEIYTNSKNILRATLKLFMFLGRDSITLWIQPRCVIFKGDRRSVTTNFESLCSWLQQHWTIFVEKYEQHRQHNIVQSYFHQSTLQQLSSGYFAACIRVVPAPVYNASCFVYFALNIIFYTSELIILLFYIFYFSWIQDK
jgi:hypothetical protein